MTDPGKSLDPAVLQGWVGKISTAEDRIAVKPSRFLEMTLDRDSSLKDGDPLPALWHWIYFLESAPMSGLGRDGHPAVGGFLPPVALPRRMWAGGRFQFSRPLLLGHEARKTSTVKSVVLKEGRSGPLCFVTVEHRLATAEALCFTEEHDIVYRADPAPGAAAPPPVAPPRGAEFHREICPSEVLLFRYSALTFNGHRIHYDLDYCRKVEGYPGLVVHGPLIATYLAGLAQEVRGARMRSFGFRAISPLFHQAPFTICGKSDGGKVIVWAETPEGALAMTAEAEFT